MSDPYSGLQMVLPKAIQTCLERRVKSRKGLEISFAIHVFAERTTGADLSKTLYDIQLQEIMEVVSILF